MKSDKIMVFVLVSSVVCFMAIVIFWAFIDMKKELDTTKVEHIVCETWQYCPNCGYCLGE